MDACHVAEDVLAGHPDRFADLVAESIVDRAVAADPDALVGVEVGVHRDAVFVTGRVAADGDHGLASEDRLHALVCETVARDEVIPADARERLSVHTDLDVGGLEDDERAIRGYSDDQSITVGHAERGPACAYLPPGPWAARRLRDALWEARCAHPDRLLADGKVLVRLREEDDRFVWERCNVAIHHVPGVDYEELHAIVVPPLATAADELDAALPGSATSWHPDLVRVNGAGDFTCGGTHGDNGLSGKKLAVDHYGPGVPLGGGALCGKDPHKVDRVGALRARQLAVRLVRDTTARAATVWLTWLPGLPAPDSVTARVDGARWDERDIRRAIHVPDLSIDASVRDLELATVRWAEVLRHGYHGTGGPWET